MMNMTSATKQNFRNQDGSIDLELALKAGHAARTEAFSDFLHTARRAFKNAQGALSALHQGTIEKANRNAYR